MVDLPDECHIADIPHRLHTAKKPLVAPLNGDDFLYLRHPPLPLGEPYLLQIPGHRHLENQSVISHQLNTPDGEPEDARFDGVNGNHCLDCQIARLSVAEVQSLNLPNENSSKIVKVKGMTQKTQPDIFTFEVVHAPIPCIYPHCEIIAYKNGKPIKDVANSMKTIIRREFAKIAERHRAAMEGAKNN
jgi:hypothetical protein